MKKCKNFSEMRQTTTQYNKYCGSKRQCRKENNNNSSQGVPSWVPILFDGLIVVGGLLEIIVPLVKEHKKAKLQKQAREEQNQAMTGRENLRHDHKQEEKTHQVDEDIRKAEAIEGIRQIRKQESNGTASTSEEEVVMKGVSFPTIGEMAIPDIKDLRICGEICAGDICVVTGATGIGKSLAVMQMAIDIASSRPSSLFPYFPVCKLPNDVFIFDAEQRLSQLKNRYFSSDKVIYPSNIKRFPEKDEVITNLDVVYNTMEKTVRESPKSIAWILDNLTFLMKHNTNVQISNFLDKIKELGQKMQAKGLYFTLIIVTHTNKKYSKDCINPIKVEYIYGSAFLADFADLIIGIHRKEDNDTTDKHPYIQIIKHRNGCAYDGFKTKRVSRPYAMLKYDDKIPPKKLFSGTKPQRDIDSSLAGIEFMYYYLYLECGMSPEEIGRLYHCCDTNIRKKFEKYIGKDYTDFPRGEHSPEKGREYFEHRMEYISPSPKDEAESEQNDQ